MVQLINCKEIADKIKENVRIKILNCDVKPTIASIVVGNNQGAKIYAQSKIKACASVGMIDKFYELDEYTKEKELIELIDKLNNDKSIHAIMCEFPLPSHINKENIISKIAKEKDADCINPINLGYLFSSTPLIIPCTPLAVMEIINHVNVNIEGENVVMVGRSNIVGKPMAQLLLEENGTVTIAHSRTKNLSTITKRADILVVAIGKPEYITKEYVKDGAVVIDVGIHRNEDNKLCGDVNFQDVEGVVSAITPVPGGVGPMTIVMLMKNCVEAVKLQQK